MGLNFWLSPSTLPLHSVPKEGDTDHLSLSLCLLTLGKGKDPLTRVQASGLCPSLSWHWGCDPSCPRTSLWAGRPPSEGLAHDSNLMKAEFSLWLGQRLRGPPQVLFRDV